MLCGLAGLIVLVWIDRRSRVVADTSANGSPVHG
jgi:hypothetical protein